VCTPALLAATLDDRLQCVGRLRIERAVVLGERDAARQPPHHVAEALALALARDEAKTETLIWREAKLLCAATDYK